MRTLPTQKQTLGIFIARAEEALKDVNWLIGMHVMKRLTGMMLNWLPDETIKYWQEADECLPGVKESEEKFLELSKNYIKGCKDWLELQ